MALIEERDRFLKLARDLHGDTITSAEIKTLIDAHGISFPFWFIQDSKFKVERNVYRTRLDPDSNTADGEEEDGSIDDDEEDLNGPDAITDDSSTNLIPHHHKGYVKFGFHEDLSMIIQSRQFWPVFIAGESGFGKTQMVYECCHEQKRELIRVQISPETDKTSLLYVPNLKDGTLNHDDGPVVEAMKKGAILLLDEIDRGTHKLICLNGILEGKPWYNEKTQELVYPKPGFNVIATGNSKGQGTSNVSYLVQILDNAFLERFAITVEHAPPPQRVEEKILTKILTKLDLKQELDFAKKLAQWAHWIRVTIDDGSDDIEMISTRRLIDICKAYKMFNVRTKALALCLNRFDKSVQKALITQYELTDLKAHDNLKDPLQEAET